MKRWHLEPWHDLVGNRLGWHWWRADEPQLFARSLDLEPSTRRDIRKRLGEWINAKRACEANNMGRAETGTAGLCAIKRGCTAPDAPSP